MKARVLVLDDERRMVEILAMVLSREGSEVQSFVDSALALGGPARWQRCPQTRRCAPGGRHKPGSPAEVAEGRFREDLYFRLSVIPVQLPPLRERRADILPLAQHFLRRYSTGLSRRVSGFAPEVEQYFLGHSWPNNVHELENTIEHGVVMASGELVGLTDLLLRPPDAARSPTVRPPKRRLPAPT